MDKDKKQRKINEILEELENIQKIVDNLEEVVEIIKKNNLRKEMLLEELKKYIDQPIDY